MTEKLRFEQKLRVHAAVMPDVMISSHHAKVIADIMENATSACDYADWLEKQNAKLKRELKTTSALLAVNSLLLAAYLLYNAF